VVYNEPAVGLLFNFFNQVLSRKEKRVAVNVRSLLASLDRRPASELFPPVTFGVQRYGRPHQALGYKTGEALARHVRAAHPDLAAPDPACAACREIQQRSDALKRIK